MEYKALNENCHRDVRSVYHKIPFWCIFHLCLLDLKCNKLTDLTLQYFLILFAELPSYFILQTNTATR